jgi:hypothetical protein
MTAESTGLPGWQRGFDIRELQAYTEPFKAADTGIILGGFTGWMERDTAEAMARARVGGEGLRYRLSTGLGGAAVGTPVACLSWRRVRTRQGIKDFTGHVRARMEPGDVVVERMGCLPGFEAAGAQLLSALANDEVDRGEALFVNAWQESPIHRAMLESLPTQLVAVKIPASSELLGVYGLARRPRVLEFVPPREEETWGLRRLSIDLPAGELEEAVAAVGRVPAWADHYSSYNKGHAWSAVSLRGFSDEPSFIIKPAEMSKRWKADNASTLEAPCRDTVARVAFPELEPLIARVPLGYSPAGYPEHQRIRLMRLGPGGGELTRHADITDPEAGTADRKLLRIHIPLVTNPGVEFSSWTLQGERYVRNMGVGSAWYLDTRKPHTAINNGTADRVHLVIDAYSSPELLEMLRTGGAA